VIAPYGSPMFRRRDATETRQARLDESEEFLQVICAGFNLDRRTARRFFYDDPYFEVNQRWGLWLRHWSEWRLVSVLTAVPLTIRIGSRAVPCYGISGVTTLPEYRRRGLASALLRAVVDALRAEGAPLAILQAFDHKFYRKHGWETVGYLPQVRLAPAQLPRYDAPPLRRAYPDDLEAVIRLYDACGARYTGSLVRDERRWQYLFWNIPNLWLADGQDGIEGYLFYDFVDSGWTLRVREMVWRTEQARRAIIGTLAVNEESVKAIEFNLPLEAWQQLGISGWQSPPSDPHTPVYTIQVLPQLMARPVSCRALLETLLAEVPAPDGFQPFTLTVRDSAGGNGETLSLTVQGSALVIGDAQPDMFTLALTPQTLALLAFGTFGVPELHARRMLHAPDAVLQTLELLFPERRPALTPIDYF
jgi:predicted acetyltransferase